MSNNDEDSLSRTTRKLAHMKLSPLQAEVLRELLRGERTTTELAFGIFGTEYGDGQFEAYHGRVRRAVKAMEKTGLIARKGLLGREKPFRLTQYGAAKVLSIIPDVSAPSAWRKMDLILFVVVPAIGIIALNTLHPVWTNLFSLILGMALFRAAQIVRRVM